MRQPLVAASLLLAACGASAPGGDAFVSRDSAGMVIAENSLAGLMLAETE